MSIPAGYEKLPGRSTANARDALAKAKANGHPEESVLTVRDGYLIPLSAEDAAKQAEAVEPSNEPDIDGMKVAELDKFIEDNSLDVDTTLNKTEKAAAIKAALEKKE